MSPSGRPTSARLEEGGVPLLEALGVGSRRPRPRYDEQPLVVHRLQAVLEHRPVDLIEDVLADVQGQVGTDAEDAGVESGVVDLAHRQAVGDHRVAGVLLVADDVRGVEELGWCRLQTVHRSALASRTCARKTGWCRRARVTRSTYRRVCSVMAPPGVTKSWPSSSAR